jgi:hypothetical protein
MRGLAGISKTPAAATPHTAAMDIDLPAAISFMAAHARPLDRRRLDLLLGNGDADSVLAALDSYRNPDGGYGWGLEPDLRAPESQIGGAYHAFETLADVGPATSPRAVELCDWLDTVTLPDGGLPFALPIADPAGCAPFWANADPTASSLQLSAFVTADAHRVAAHDPAVAAHPWLAGATDYCLAAIDALDAAPFAIELNASVQFLNAVHDTRPEAAGLLRKLGEHIPADGRVPVTGGAEGETMRALDFAPLPGRPVRELFDAAVIDAELRTLANEQQDDGGWRVDFQSYSPAAALEWRGYATVRAIETLRAT